MFNYNCSYNSSIHNDDCLCYPGFSGQQCEKNEKTSDNPIFIFFKQIYSWLSDEEEKKCKFDWTGMKCKFQSISSRCNFHGFFDNV